jgi:RimJ/RimL family protein N-acetyltransferase
MQEIKLQTPRLTLRKLEEQDCQAFFDYRSLPEVYRYQSWRPERLEDAEHFIRQNMQQFPETPGTWLQLAVCLPDGSLIGDIGIHFLDNDQIEIGYTLAPQYQGKGYASEAIKGVVNYVFSVLGKHRITASVDPANMASIRLLQRLGFRKEAHFVKSFRMEGQWLDDCIYAILAEEWIKRILPSQS